MIDEPQVDGSHSAVKAIEHQSNNPANLKHEPPHIDFHILEDAQVASMAAVPGHEGKSVDTGSNTFELWLKSPRQQMLLVKMRLAKLP